MSLKKLIAVVKSHKRFLITAHTNLEGDAIGSELAFYRMLKAMGKQATIVNVDASPYGYDFLPGINNIKRFKRGLRDIDFDCFVVLDCSDLARCGDISKIDLKNKTVINIDHHISNANFADINWVKPSASSTCEMLYLLHKKLGITLDKETATILYTGILTDTGSFRYSNTTAYTHEVIAKLLKYNLDVAKIYKNVYENIPFSDMKLLSKILPTMKRDAMGKIVWFKIERKILENKKMFFDLTDHILGFARAIKDVEVAILFKENLGVKDEIRVNFRSQGKIDVNAIASFFGGGGHRTASGCTIRGKLDTVIKKVLAKIREVLR